MSKSNKQQKNMAIHLFSGGVAGCCEALVCHPLDTIKVRLQLRGAVVKRTTPPITNIGINAVNSAKTEAVKPKRQGFVSVGVQIAQKEGVLALYKGLGAVVAGIVPKMAIRFASFDFYKEKLSSSDGKISSAGIFLAGLGAGATESVMIVNPMDVIKIRLQSQRHSMTDPMDIPKYRNAAHCAYVMIKEEGFASLYKGVTLTVLRQGTNQAANFTVYQYLKSYLIETQKVDTLPFYQTMLMGFISGACGPLFNAPIDTIKTRIQKTPSTEPGWTRFINISKSIIQNEGYRAFYKGLVPRVLRVAPGQSITFLVYERVYKWCVDLGKAVHIDEVQSSGLAVQESQDN